MIDRVHYLSTTIDLSGTLVVASLGAAPAAAGPSREYRCRLNGLVLMVPGIKDPESRSLSILPTLFLSSSKFGNGIFSQTSQF
jgi:hypothetical protein